jgi:hypothetical protein
VVIVGDMTGRSYAQSFNIQKMGLTMLSISGTTPEVVKTLIQNVKEACDLETLQVDLTKKQAVAHKGSGFMSL